MAIGFGKIAKNAAQAAGKAVVSVAETAKTGAQKASDSVAKAQKEMGNRLYNPLFPDEYTDPDFDRPKLIVVSDEDERKGVGVCVGAIGWMRRNLTPEVMHLYEEFLPESGLSFYPYAACDAAYIVDRFDPNRYIEKSQFLEVARRDQMTELKQIAHMLGAKKCRLEYIEEKKSSVELEQKSGRRVKAPVEENPKAVASVGYEQSASFNRNEFASSTMLFEQVFEGDIEPTRPKLKWYKDDKEILDLIETRLDKEKNTTKSYRVEIGSFASMCMSAGHASKIDFSLDKAGVKGDFSLAGQYEAEARKKMTFEVVF